MKKCVCTQEKKYEKDRFQNGEIWIENISEEHIFIGQRKCDDGVTRNIMDIEGDVYRIDFPESSKDYSKESVLICELLDWYEHELTPNVIAFQDSIHNKWIIIHLSDIDIGYIIDALRLEDEDMEGKTELTDFLVSLFLVNSNAFWTFSINLGRSSRVFMTSSLVPEISISCSPIFTRKEKGISIRILHNQIRHNSF